MTLHHFIMKGGGALLKLTVGASGRTPLRKLTILRISQFFYDLFNYMSLVPMSQSKLDWDLVFLFGNQKLFSCELFCFIIYFVVSLVFVTSSLKPGTHILRVSLKIHFSHRFF